MGRSYLFECSRCGYKAKVSGGTDSGRDFSVQTIHCRECKKLYDAVIRLKVPGQRARPLFDSFARFRAVRKNSGVAPAFETVANQLPVPGSARFAWARFKLRCPTSSVHKVDPWNDPGKCPRCGMYLERNALPFRIWE